MPKRSPGLRVAFECGEDWTRFAGEGATRLCDRCVKQVHDLSALTRSEATELLRYSAARVCVRFTHDGEGRVLFRSERFPNQLVWQRFVVPPRADRVGEATPAWVTASRSGPRGDADVG